MKTTKINLNETDDRFKKFVYEAKMAKETAWTITNRPAKKMTVDGKEAVVIL